MDLDTRIGRIVERTRATWGICTIIAFFMVMTVSPWWAIFPFILFSVGTYFASLWAVGVILGYMITDEEYAQAMAGSEDKNETVSESQTEDSLVVGDSVGEVVQTSEPIGRYLDLPIFDWVDINEPTGKVRYVFEHVTQRDTVGNLLLPRGEGFACFNGITYKRAGPARAVN